MASYVDSNLGKDEHVLYRAKVSWVSQIKPIILGLIWVAVAASLDLTGFGVAGLVVAIMIAVLNVLTTELALTNKKVIAKFGFITRQTVELNLDKVESLSVNQSILGRMLNFGSIVVRGAGATGVPIPNIAQPLEFRKQVNEFLDTRSATKP